ncbi:FtsQ-type POTRA domain-containing protein [Agrococcus sp. SCSIO52902]|uniref:cell division protein FtsQ/DivIB n=1 Tax=Agrococcus sp. SCSIO52902 TaxID=2933290 RepID=UPI001FF42857|nr:FtsQ-type POTRA domain-containing protein [Agrococcus sp. SCSIO52902]UOW00220.1 FtsQ-type POTRA domain-containing protein [Agrococcus sp. SCSIO52902]
MRRPDGFDRRTDEPVEAPADADDAAGGSSLDALRRRRDAALRAIAAHEAAARRGSAEREPEREPRRWALSAYADLDEGADAAPATGGPSEPAPLPDEERGSLAQRVDRAWREAQREQRRLDREEARETRREAKEAKRARVRRERAEVRRFTAARRRQVRAALLTGGGLALALLLLVGLVWSPLMAVREVRVQGVERLDAAVVQEALGDAMGEPIATVTEEGVAQRLSTIPQIESFRVDVVPPSTVIVHVVERRPVAIVPTASGEAVIDAAGVALGPVDEATAMLPRLDGVELGSAEFEAIAAMLVAVPTSVLEATATISAPTESDIRLSLTSGQTVLWGGADESRLKADVVAALLATQDPAVAVVLDVRAPEHSVVRGS